MQNIINAIKAVDGVTSIRIHEATSRYYINLRGNGGKYRGEQTSKLYVTASGLLVWECGKGTRSGAYDDQRHAVEAAIASV